MKLEGSQEERVAVAREALEAVEKRKLGRPTINQGRRLTRAEKQARYFDAHPEKKAESLARLASLKEKKR
jgi:hypothetical protein